MSKAEAVAAAEAHLARTEPVEIIKGSGAMLGAPQNSLTLLATLVAREQVPVEAIEKLVQLHREEEDRAARRAFGAALAEFQAECPIVPKTSQAARSTTKSGAAWGGYQYAALDEIAKTVRPFLHKHGFSYSWDTEILDGQPYEVCRLTHSMGHSTSSRFPVIVDAAAAMSAVQKVSSATKYAQRRSLERVLGLSTGEPDDDAMEGAEQIITADQAATLAALITEANPDHAKFRVYLKTNFGVETIEHLPAAAYDRVVRDLEIKRKAR